VAATTRQHRERIRRYYRETSEASYLQHWAKGSLGFHFGLADESTTSLAESILAANQFLADRADIGESTRVLDAGCGVGGSSLWLARERGAIVTGVTISPEQADLAMRLAGEQDLAERTQFSCADMCATDLPEASFDVVWQLESLCHVEDLDGYVDHLLHLLRDGGRFACIDLCRGDPVDSAREKLVCDGWSMVFPMRRIDRVADALQRAGFEGVETLDLTSRARLSAEVCKAMAHNTLPLLKAERLMLGVDNAIYQGHAESALAMAEGLLDGTLRLGHVLARRPARDGS
jgi:cyclopropane fatty-acyl-phospholipid synthase-like methyltransferase